MPPADFGPFAILFERGEFEVPTYLELLSLRNVDRVQIVIDLITSALEEGPPGHWVRALMSEQNWRPHLVGAVAFLLDRDLVLDRADLWAAMDLGSWVIPQLAVTAFLTDGCFLQRTQARLDRYCPLAQSWQGDFQTPDEANPASLARSGKLAASLLCIVSRTPALHALEAGWRADPRLQELLALDAAWDRSESITGNWLDRIRSCFRVRGVELG